MTGARLTSFGLSVAVGVICIQPFWLAHAQMDTQKDWLVFDDAVLRFKYPKGYVVESKEIGNQQHSWVANSPPHSSKDDKFRIWQSRDGMERRPLDKIVQGRITLHSDFRTLSGPSKVLLPGGECRQLRQEDGSPGCAFDLYAPRRRMPAKRNCFSADTQVICYNKRKSFFEISSDWSFYAEKGKPDDAARKDADLFDAILKTLEFK